MISIKIGLTIFCAKLLEFQIPTALRLTHFFTFVLLIGKIFILHFSDTMPPLPRLKRKPLSPIADMVDYNGHASDDDYNPFNEDASVYM